jgi:transcriptional regulator with PAS, ATPase and Fis domain
VPKRKPDVVFEPVMRSAAMRKADQVLRAVAGKDVALTLIGESGTGKEVMARRAHELSDRRAGPFIPINCAAIPDALFESEIFGHERGSFTGASERTRGKIEAADKGTLFLDEIGEMPMAMQAKLLRFLDNRRYMRVGGTTKIQADVRLIFATLRPLEAEVMAGRFRSDLFYRIQGITLVLPPLRERRADIAPLLAQFVEQMCGKHAVAAPHLTREANALLLEHDWPGNVRELRNLVESLCLLRGGRTATPAHLPASLRTRQGSSTDAVKSGSASITLDLDQGLEAMTSRVIEAALQLEDGDKRKAAARLQVSLRRIQRYVASGRVRHRSAAKR